MRHERREKKAFTLPLDGLVNSIDFSDVFGIFNTFNKGSDSTGYFYS